MDRLTELDAELEVIRARLEDLAEMPEPDETDEVARAQILDDRSNEIDDLTARWDELMEERGPLVERARKLEEVKRAAKDLARVEPGDGSRYLGGTGPAFSPKKDPFEGDVERASREEVISRAMTILDRERHVPVADDSKEQVERYLQRSGSQDEGMYQLDGDYIGRRMILTENPVYRSAFQKYVHLGAAAQLAPEEQRALADFQNFEIRRAMNETTASAGGVGVPVLIDPSIILTSAAADVPLLRYCRIETVTNNLWKGVSSAGMVWSYTTEATEASDDSPTLAQPTVAVHRASGFLPYSIEISMDYVGFANEMGTLLNSGYQDLLARKTMHGTGTDEPFGIFNALVAVGASQQATQSDGVFQGQDIFNAWAKLPERYRANATWVMSVSVQNAIRAFAASTAATSAYFTIDLTGGMFRINDRPVVLTDYAPSFTSGVPGTTGAANILAVGDWRQSYLWVNRAGMSVEQVPLLMGPTNRFPTGQRGLYAWARNGGNIVNSRGGVILLNT